MVTLDYPHISRAPGDTARLERHPRIRVAQIAADHLGNGWSAEEILRQYPWGKWGREMGSVCIF